MNQEAVDVLVAAALAGRRQVYGRLSTSGGGRCALGFLCEAAGLVHEDGSVYYKPEILGRYGLSPRLRVNPMGNDVACLTCSGALHEPTLITHLNDDHEWDLLTIARKLGPSEVPA